MVKLLKQQINEHVPSKAVTNAEVATIFRRLFALKFRKGDFVSSCALFWVLLDIWASPSELHKHKQQNKNGGEDSIELVSEGLA